MTHRAAIAWRPGADAELARLADALGTLLLMVSASGQTVWGWLGAGAGANDRALRTALGDWPGGLAFGRAAAGPAGFRTSHREARAAHRIGVATGDAVTHFDEVASESLMLADEHAARALVAAELSPLDAGRDGAKLRETLSAYFACGFNASAAAAMLKVNDRTIAYRLNAIEQLLGRPVHARQAELQAAIRLERVLGTADHQ
jgi:DNA-binding PucR family transcriptional regulator